MTTEALLELNVDDLTEEEARRISIDLLDEDVENYRDSLKRNGIWALILTIAMIAVGMNTVPGYAIMGLDAVALTRTFDSLQEVVIKKKMLAKMRMETYDKGYHDFVRACQEHVAKAEAMKKKAT